MMKLAAGCIKGRMLAVILGVALAGCDFADPVPRGGAAAEVRAAGPAATAQAEPADTVRAGEPARDRPADDKTANRPANRLAGETSPYLLMHAHNPVDWYPWGEEALARARDENKMIFLSIGYSSCYWCHVMERESFMDEEIARLLNQHFVCIKVDREERPDVDDIYMTALQIYFRLANSSQGGGWPLSMFLTPDAEPVLGGTYFPPRSRDGRVGFLDVIERVVKLWETQREQVRTVGKQLAEAVRETVRSRDRVAMAKPDESIIDELIEQLGDSYDERYGGFGYSPSNPQRPKFPQPTHLMFLLQQAGNAAASPARKMLAGTLQAMARGGIRDHIGGGFHRYSTDRYWRIPHFEKMLYDNAQLTTVYAEAFALTGDEQYRRIVEQVIAFVLREMTDKQGGFYSAIDAETDAEEGKFYVWTVGALRRALTPEQYALVSEVYGVSDGPNFEDHHVLLMEASVETLARQRGITPEALLTRLEPARQALLAARDGRERPLVDTKILTAWNGLMIRGMADAGRILNHSPYIDHASRAARFVLRKLRSEDGRLFRSYRGQQSKLNGYLVDYALLVEGLIALHRADGNREWLRISEELTSTQIELFWDDEHGGFFFTSHDHQRLIARAKKVTDGAVPSGNAVAAANLMYLADELGQPEYRERARQTIESAAPFLQEAPMAMPRMAMALADLLAGSPP